MRNLSFKIPWASKIRDYSKIKCVDNCMKKGLSGFVFGSANNDIKRILDRICKGKDISVPIVILGDSGSGKTYLSSCITQELQKFGKQCLRETTESCVDRMVRIITDNKTEETFLEYYKKADVIIIDEIEGLSYKLSTQKILLDSWGDLITEGKYVILMGLRRMEDLSVIMKSGCMVFHLNNINEAQRKQYIRKILRTSGIKLSRDDIDLIARQNMGAIVGGLNRLLITTIDKRKLDYVCIDSEKAKCILGAGFYNDPNMSDKNMEVCDD